MPVVVPWRKSTDTVKAVRWLSVLSCTIRGRSSCSQRSAVSGMQMTPEVWRRKNAIASGVANSAAMMRSPSFSRSSSSTTTTISPRPMAATASSIFASGTSPSLPLQEPLDVLGGDVHLEVHTGAAALRPERRDVAGVRDDRHCEPVVERVDDGEADSVDRDRSLDHDVAHQLAIAPDMEVGRRVGDLAHGVDVSLDQMAAEPVD